MTGGISWLQGFDDNGDVIFKIQVQESSSSDHRDPLQLESATIVVGFPGGRRVLNGGCLPVLGVQGLLMGRGVCCFLDPEALTSSGCSRLSHQLALERDPSVSEVNALVPSGTHTQLRHLTIKGIRG